MVVLTTRSVVESPIDLTIHHDRRKSLDCIDAGFFPKNLSRNRQEWIFGIARAAYPIGVPVTGGGNSLDYSSVKASVRIGEVLHGRFQPRLEGLLRQTQLILD